MCNFWSCILHRDGRVLHVLDEDCHEAIIQHYHLNDNKLVDRDFIRIEITPRNALSRDRADWSYRLDEPRTLPDWYANDTRRWDAVVWAEWERVMSEQIWDTPWYGRVTTMRDRLTALRPGEAAVSRSAVRAALEEHRKRLMALDGKQRQWAISEVRFYSPAEWTSISDSVKASICESIWGSVWTSVWHSVKASTLDSVRASIRASIWDSVWTSVWDSVWDSVKASVRVSIRAPIWGSVKASVWASFWDSVLREDAANHGLPLTDVLAAGCVLYGIDDDGVAHVIMVGQDGGEQ